MSQKSEKNEKEIENLDWNIIGSLFLISLDKI